MSPERQSKARQSLVGVPGLETMIQVNAGTNVWLKYDESFYSWRLAHGSNIAGSISQVKPSHFQESTRKESELIGNAMKPLVVCKVDSNAKVNYRSALTCALSTDANISPGERA